MEILSVLNLIEYINVSNYFYEHNHQPSTKDLSTIKLYRHKIKLLSEPELEYLLIKRAKLNESIFGPNRTILEYLPSYLYFSHTGNHTYATLETTGNPVRIDGYAGHWQIPLEPKLINQEFLIEHNYIENDRKLLRNLTFQGLNEFYHKMSTVSHLEPEYKEMMECTIIQVKLKENKTQKKMGAARGLCSA